eukprot:scaffold4882_cov70-Phaeocystis_antarctica.AAC.19
MVSDWKNICDLIFAKREMRRTDSSDVLRSSGIGVQRCFSTKCGRSVKATAQPRSSFGGAYILPAPKKQVYNTTGQARSNVPWGWTLAR